MRVIKEISPKIYRVIMDKDLGFDTCLEFFQGIKNSIPECKKFYLDFKNLDMIDSSVIGGILTLYSIYKCEIVIKNTNDSIRKVFTYTGLNKAPFVEISSNNINEF